MSDDVTVIETEAPLRHDVRPEGVAPKRRGRPPKVRHDTAPEQIIPMNGYGDPFTIKLVPGWVAYWVDDNLLSRMGDLRPWTAATWGDPRVLAYSGARQGEKGRPIKFKELACYLMREEDHIALHAHDPKRESHRQKMNGIYSGAVRTDYGMSKHVTQETI